MCGIAGWFGETAADAAESQRLLRMSASIASRGPDGQGERLLPNAALAHRRLSIIDPAGGAQPFSFRDSVHLVFNGEIYNYRSLRASLSAEGFEFQSHSDTEVILACYLLHGAEGWNQMRGMFAFALWDEDRQSGWLCRDSVGIKPLFYSHQQGRLWFGSEAKALFAGGVVEPVRSNAALHMLMNFRYLPGEDSLFEGVAQLAPGTMLNWRGGDLRSLKLVGPEAAAGDDFIVSVAESVGLHCEADVDIACYLSGGIDSALVAHYADQQRPGLSCYTLDAGDDPREAQHAEQTAGLLGLHQETLSMADSPPDMTALIRQLEVPKVNALQLSMLAAKVACRQKVVLSGVGGDELAYGYNAHRWFWLARRASALIPGFVARSAGAVATTALSQLAAQANGEPERMARILANLPVPSRCYGLMRNVWDSPKLRQLIYGPAMLDSGLPDAWEWLESAWPKQQGLEAMAAFEWRHKMVNDLLWQEDRVSMAHGLEVRTPLVDVPLYKAARARSAEYWMPGGRPKARLRQLIQPVLPAAILQRPKSGFQVDSPRFVSATLAPLMDHYLSDSELARTGLFNPLFVKRVRAAKPRTGLRWHYFMLYLMLGAQVWESIDWRQRRHAA